eukprot:ANDGO_08150.mRNA.1 Actin-related protein 2/3 complex subunit 3
MVYHSEFANSNAQIACSIPILPVKTSVRGPAPAFVASSPDARDIVDETLYYFKSNVLFRNFEVKNSADRLLIYLTMYTSLCLQKLEDVKDKNAAVKALTMLASESVSIPGDGTFTLNAFFEKPKSAAEGETCRTYFKQVREELGIRLAERVFETPVSKKYWLCFSKRKFLNKTL